MKVKELKQFLNELSEDYDNISVVVQTGNALETFKQPSSNIWTDLQVGILNSSGRVEEVVSDKTVLVIYKERY